tara:strand:- start:586 stop:990 length:405 start_codon:yes stop_codon:yes gene_type:complete
MISNSEALGKIVWLMGHSRHHHTFRVQDCFRVMIPAIANHHYRIWEGKQHPLGCMTWAWLNEENHNKYLAGQKIIESTDFTGGDNLWIVDIICPFGNVRQLLSEGRKHLIDLYGKGKVFNAKRTKNGLIKKVRL